MLIAELTLRSPIFAETFERCPGTELTVDSQHRLEGGTIQMLTWAAGTDREAFETALDADSTIADHHCLAAEAGRLLYRVRFSDAATEYSVHHRWTELGGTLLDAVGTADGWNLRMRFPDRDAVQAFYRTAEERGVGITVQALYGTLDDDGREFGLTEKQRDAVELAFSEGYFSVPRQSNLTDLTTQVDVSRQAFSRRLTRGLHTLVENTLVDTRQS